MSISRENDILTLSMSADGSPWVRVTTDPNTDLETLELSADGSPWHGFNPSPLFVLQVNNNWKNISTISDIKICVNGVWKNTSIMYIKSGIWKMT